jgi:hypothetical protein
MTKFSRSFLSFVFIVVAVAVQKDFAAAQESSLNSSILPVQTTAAIEVASLDALPSAPDVSSSTSTANVSFFATAPAPMIEAKVPREPIAHRFWDRENMVLFAAVGGMAGADFYVTHANLASGGRELNPVTRVLSGSTPGLATNFALETGSMIGVSYLLHKTGHHKLERIASMMNVASSAGAITYGLTHR